MKNFIKSLNALIVVALGVFTFVPVALADTQTFSTPTTFGVFTVPAGVTSITVDVLGAGAGGGGGAYSFGGGGGGAGSYITGVVISVTPGQIIPYTVGAGGVGGVSGFINFAAGNGTNGGFTTFGTTTAQGGNGGQGAVYGNSNSGQGGLSGGFGGTNGGNGDVQINTERNYGGAGGTTSIGTGGVGGFGNASTRTFPTAGTLGNGGGAGSGWASGDAVLRDAGANGGDGQIVLTYWPDLVAPVITILGSNPLILEASSTGVYVDLGATAFDTVDGVLAVTTIFNDVNLAATGTYSVVYSATDLAGNTATSSRTVIVGDTTAPTITSVPATQYFEATGATTTPILIPITATDNLTASPIITYSPTGFPLGTTTVTWTATDASGNVSTTTSDVVIIDTTGPAIVLNGLNPMSVLYGSVFTDPFATAFDLVDGTTTVTATGTVNTLVIGTSTIIYTSTDLSGNVSTSSRTVDVVATAPVLTTLTIAPLDAIFTVGSSTTYVATTLDQYGNPIVSSVFWGSSNTTVGTIVFNTGFFNAAATGTTVITAISGSLTATTTATVTSVSTSTLSNVTIINSTLGGTFYGSYTPTLAETVIAPIATTTGSTTITNSTLSTFWNVNDSSITNTSVDDTNLNNVTVSNSSLLNSDITNCTIINSLVKNYLAVNCYIAFSTVDPTTLYEFINSTSTNSQIYASNIYNSIISNNSYVATSTVSSSTIDASTVLSSTVATSTITNGSTVTNSDVTLSTLNNADITDSTSTNSTITDSTVSSSSVVTDSTITAGSVISSSTLTNVVSASSSITNTVLSNATTTNAVIDSGIIYSGTIEIGGNTYVITTPTLISSLVPTDTVAPVITILGNNPENILVGGTYTDAGATAFDVFDATSTLVSATGTVDTNTVGTYTIVYSTSDLALNIATSSRTVNVNPIVIPDTVAPVITINGLNPVSIVVGGTYTDLGATAFDAYDATSTSVSATGTVDVNTIGVYTIVYSSSDLAGNVATSSRTVNVLATADTIAPVITILGNNPENILVGAVYTDAGATSTDNIDGNITANIVATGTVNTAIAGAYSITYSVSDSSGNIASSTRVVNVNPISVPDTTAPVITIVGANPVTVVVGGSYTDAGATALDNVDGNITANINTFSTVNTTVVGAYSVTYTVSDAALNSATATRTVNVVAVADTISPVITILGNNPENITVGAVYTDAGATATDNVDGNITANIITTGLPINTSVAGTQFVTYSVTDGAGNSTSSQRTVNIIAVPADTIPPVITMNGGNVTITVGSTYTDLGATAFDAVSGTTSVTTVNNVNASVVGTYSVDYSATDVAGNTATTSRIVNVIAAPADTIAPAITITGGTPVTVVVNTSYTDQGATAIDNIDGDVTASITATGTVDINTVGSYSIVYTATDSSLNSSTATRVVDVVVGSTTADVIPPAILITGGTPVTVVVNTSYTDQGATAIDDVDGAISATTTSNNVDINTVGSYSVVYSATDSSNNTSTATRTVFVVAAPADNIPPVITINGGSPLSVALNGAYTDLGATSYDAYDNATTTLIGASNVNTAVVGSYTVVYSASDIAGNQASSTRVVNVIADTVAPVITILGTNPMDVILTLPYVESGATSIDNLDGNITAGIVTTGSVNVNATGTYLIVYTSTDSSGNTSSSTRTVNVINDNVPPVITINGANPFNMTVGGSYTDAGATANDNIDGPVTATTTSNNVNTAVVGSYAVVYTATDSSGNSTSSTRVVNVNAADTIPPVITINGANPVTVLVGASYTDAGATALDNNDGVRPVTSTSTVNTAVAGAYTVTYTSSDTLGNTSTSSRTVNVVSTPDTTQPIIVILGANPASLTVGGTYTDAGATASDNVDGDITVNIIAVSTVNTAVVGTYSVTYSVTDGAGNATSTSRTVNVVAAPVTPPVSGGSGGGGPEVVPIILPTADRTAPVITLNGTSAVTLGLNDTYTELGATAQDNVDGDVTLNINVVSSVNTSVSGTYPVNYSVTDRAGNTGSATRIVTVSQVGSTVVTEPTNTGNTGNQGNSGTGTGIEIPSGVGEFNPLVGGNEVSTTSTSTASTTAGIALGLFAATADAFSNIPNKPLISLILLVFAALLALMYYRKNKDNTPSTGSRPHTPSITDITENF